MATPVTFDPEIGRQLLKYARLLAARGYVHNTLGNIVMRVPHPDYPHGLAYTKHAELSLEDPEGGRKVLRSAIAVLRRHFAPSPTGRST